MIRKGYKETFWNAKKVLCLSLGAGYMGVYILKFTELYTEDLFILCTSLDFF